MGLYNAWSGTESTGEEVILGCGTDGYVYELDRGTSFDGAALNAAITLNFDSVRSPRMLKRFRKAAIEVQGSSYAEISFGYNLGYSSNFVPQPSPFTYNQSMLDSTWGSAVWGQFFWGISNLSPMECDMGGTAENAGLIFASGEDYMASYTINSAIIHYTPRRALR